MRFVVATEISYAVSGPSTLILQVHAMRSGTQMIHDESFVVQPKVRCEEFVLEQGQNRFVRIETGPAKELKINYSATVETRLKTVPSRKLNATGLGRIDRPVIPFLYPSRYCQSDKLARLAYSKFGKIENPFEKVTAVSTWIHENVQYLTGSTNSQTSAYDTVTERAGVCRDFAHLGIALCRALNIPARYFAGYAHQLNPPDFHACFEAYIDQLWLVFDPRAWAAERSRESRHRARRRGCLSCYHFRPHPLDVDAGLLRPWRPWFHATHLQATSPKSRLLGRFLILKVCHMSALRITHETIYQYVRPVGFGPHRLVLRPREGHDLQVERMALTIEPAHSLEWHRDVFGNSIGTASFHSEASRLRILSEVDVRRFELPRIAERRNLPVPYPVVYDELEATVAYAYLHLTYPAESSTVNQWAQNAIEKQIEPTLSRSLLL